MNTAMRIAIALAVFAATSYGGFYLYDKHDQQMTQASLESMDWPSVTGLVTESGVETTSRKVGGVRKTRTVMTVSYEYVVGDTLYHNDTVRFDQGSLSRSGKERLAGAYPVGKQVQVFYNPDKPKQAVLVRGSYP